MRRFEALLAGVLLAVSLAAPLAAAPDPTADEIIANYVAKIGGMDKLQAVKTLKKTGKFTGGGGFEAKVVEENKRPAMVRQELVLQGMTGVTAYDGKQGWKIEPWQGKKDVESLGEDEMKRILEDSDFDGPLVNYKEKGNKVELVGKEPVEGTDAWKLRVTLANGDVHNYFMDTDYFVPIKVEQKRVVRGAERETETSIGDYKEVAGVYFPHSFETGQKGSSNRSKVVFDRIEANVPLDDAHMIIFGWRSRYLGSMYLSQMSTGSRMCPSASMTLYVRAMVVLPCRSPEDCPSPRRSQGRSGRLLHYPASTRPPSPRTGGEHAAREAPRRHHRAPRPPRRRATGRGADDAHDVLVGLAAASSDCQRPSGLGE